MIGPEWLAFKVGNLDHLSGSLPGFRWNDGYDGYLRMNPDKDFFFLSG